MRILIDVQQYCHLLSTVLICFCSSGLAQPTDIRFDRLTVEQGLSQGTVLSIAQDQQGFLWFGTADGLNRYDGYEFKVFKNDPRDSTSLSSNVILSLRCDRNGTLWIGTLSGLNTYDPLNDRFHRFTSPPAFASDRAYVCEDRAGIIWIGGRTSKLHAFDAGRREFLALERMPMWKSILDSIADVTSLLEDRSENLWIGTDNGLYSVDKHRDAYARHDLRDRMFNAKPHGMARSICQDFSGALWVATRGGGLIRFDPHTSTRTRFVHDPANSSSIGSNVVFSVLCDRNGTIWAATEAGISKLIEGSAFDVYHHDPSRFSSLPTDVMQSAFEDRSGILWFGTFNAGIAKHNPRQRLFSHVYHLPGRINTLSNNNVWRILEDPGGQLWVGTDKGLNRFDPVTKSWDVLRHNPRDPSSLSHDIVISLLRDRFGTLWVGTRGGALSAYDEERRSFIRPVLPPNLQTPITELYEDPTGDLWVGTGSGLCRLVRPAPPVENIKFVFYDDKRFQGLGEVWISGLLRDAAGILWVGTIGEGLYSFDPVSENISRFEQIPGDVTSLQDNQVISIAEDPWGNLWVGTGNGLSVLDRGSGKFQTFTEEDGLANAFIYAILPDSADNLWVSTNRGISRCRILPRTPEDSATGAQQARPKIPHPPVALEVTNFDARDGLQGNEFSVAAAYRSARGELFFGGPNGFNRFFPELITPNPHVPPVTILSFRKLDRPTKFDSAMSAVQQVDLEYSDYFFSIEYAALDFHIPERNRYRYIMEGFDKDWIDAGNRRFVTYTNLDPGDYVFRVKGSNSDGVWNEQGAIVQITITPPFWETWWFRTLIAVLFVNLLFLAYRIRVRQILAVERLRTRIASDLHDDVGSALTRIAVHSEVIRSTSDREKVLTSSQTIGEMSREIVGTLSDLVWSIDARRDTFQELVNRMRSFGLDLLSAKEIRFQLTTEVSDLARKIPVDLRQNLYLIFKETVNNIAKHAGATEASASLVERDGWMIMSIQDNGKGLPEELRSSGQGLRNMKMRAERVGGVIEFLNSNGLMVVVKVKMG